MSSAVNKPLRINFMAAIHSMIVGGAERICQDILLRIDRDRFNPILLCMRESGPLAERVAREGIKVYSNLTSDKYDFTVALRLQRIMRHEEIHALETFGSGEKLFWGRLCAKWAGVPAITSSLHKTFIKGKSHSVEFLNRMLWGLNDRIIAIGEASKDYLVRYEGVPDKKVTVIYNGIDLERFKPRSPELRIKRELGIPEENQVVGILAVLRPEKAHQVFLESAKIISEGFPKVSFLVVGDGSERAELEKLSSQLGLDGRVIFAGNRSDVPEVLSIFDVAVLCSDPYIETLPTAILEAMAMAKPAVATEVGCLREMIIDGTNGYLLPPRKPKQLAEAISELLRSEELAQKMGQAGRKRTEELFSIERMVGKREELFEEILEEKKIIPRRRS
jgi:glycosyltransferase involved in cell wall biosynthesis